MPGKGLAHRLRTGRFSVEGQVYMLTATTRGRIPLFQDLRLGRLLVHELRLAQEQQLAETLAWVVMPDHLHWLLVLGDDSLGKLVQRIKSKSAIAINRVRGTSGQIWQPAYHDTALRREQDLPDLARYIVDNPIRAGLVTQVGDYPLWDTVWV